MAFPSRSELWQWRIEEYLSRGTIGLAEAIGLILLLDHSNDSNMRRYGGLYRDAAVTLQAVPNNAWTKLDALTNADAMPTAGGVVSDAVAGEIVLPTAGDWLVSWNLSFSGSSNSAYEFAAFGNTTKAAGTGAARELGSGSAAGIGSLGAAGIVTAPVAGVALTLACRHGEGSARDVTVERMQLTAHEVTSPPTLSRGQYYQDVRTLVKQILTEPDPRV